jgi:hypothetical protein
VRTRRTFTRASPDHAHCPVSLPRLAPLAVGARALRRRGHWQTGFCLRTREGAPAITVAATGGALAAFGAYAFVYDLWRTIDGRAKVKQRATATKPTTRALPTLS